MSGTRRTARLATTGVALLLALGAVGTACGSSADDASDGTTTTTGGSTVTTPVPDSTAPTTSQPSSSTSSTPSTSGPVGPSTTVPAFTPGQPCPQGSDPDCIDPEGTGDYVYLIGGADCMAGPLAGPMCTDLDGDGRAGYPDRG